MSRAILPTAFGAAKVAGSVAAEQPEHARCPRGGGQHPDVLAAGDDAGVHDPLLAEPRGERRHAATRPSTRPSRCRPLRARRRLAGAARSPRPSRRDPPSLPDVSRAPPLFVQHDPQGVDRRERGSRNGPRPSPPRTDRHAGPARHPVARTGRTARPPPWRGQRRPSSSAGWKTAISVPDHPARSAASSAIAASRQVTCMSWPQACVIGTSRPSGSVPRSVQAYGSPVSPGRGRTARRSGATICRGDSGQLEGASVIRVHRSSGTKSFTVATVLR